MFSFICKRDGKIVPFDSKKIGKALQAAINASGIDDTESIDEITLDVVQYLEEYYHNSIPHVEDVQDAVESILIKSGYDEVAKTYIRYRQQRALARADDRVTIDVGNTVNEYLDHVDWRVNENANIGYSIGGMILKNSEKLTANYWLSHIYPPEVENAHRNADIHIHDLGMFTGYCAGWSLRQLLEEGFNGVPSKVQSSPPKNMQSAVNQMVNFFGTLQNERAGAQAFSSFDTYLAPYVHKYSQEVREELVTTQAHFNSEEAKESFVYDKTRSYVKQQMQNFVFGLNAPSRWGTQTPFTNITLDWVCPDDLKDKSLILGGSRYGNYCKTFGELCDEMRMVNEVLIEVYTEGDWNGSVFTFPIPTYNITEDFPREDPAIDALFEMTAKYGIPYFQNFIGSQYFFETNGAGERVKIINEKAYKPGSVRSMCCRLQLDLTQLEKRGGGLFGSAEMTGSIGVVTLNMARIGYLYKGDKEGFFARIGQLMDLAKQSLELKRKEINKWLEKGFYPYTKRYLPSLRNHFSTIGINGMNEALLNFSDGAFDIASESGQLFAMDVLEMMRDMLKAYQEETGNLYNLEATPAEGTTYRFAKEDQKRYPDIINAGTQDAPYYTNSSQLPVGFTDDPFEALTLQDELQCAYTGGTVLHLYMGERIPDAQSCKLLVKRALENHRLPYVTVTPTFSICPKHGYIVGEHDFCPHCDKEIGYVGQEFDMDTRMVYTKDADKLAHLDTKKIVNVSGIQDQKQ